MSDQEAGRSLAALVRSAARQRPDAPAVVTRAERLTWAELDAAVDRAAAGYAARDLAPGDRVAVQLPNGLPWLRAVLGAARQRPRGGESRLPAARTPGRRWPLK